MLNLNCVDGDVTVADLKNTMQSIQEKRMKRLNVKKQRRIKQFNNAVCFALLVAVILLTALIVLCCLTGAFYLCGVIQ